MAELMQERNAEVVALAAARRYRVERRGDGEVVIRLPGKAGAHAGRWGVDLSYVLVPCSRPSQRAKILMGSWPGLIDRSGDVELLMLGPHGAIESILASGPAWARARRKRAAAAADHLAAFQKPPTPAAFGGQQGTTDTGTSLATSETTTEAFPPRHGRAHARLTPGVPDGS